MFATITMAVRTTRPFPSRSGCAERWQRETSANDTAAMADRHRSGSASSLITGLEDHSDLPVYRRMSRPRFGRLLHDDEVPRLQVSDEVVCYGSVRSSP
jgi:hypothetical protein